MLYRTLVPALLCSVAVWAAPKDAINSDITYVKIQPVIDAIIPTKSPYRESRIENLPLTIPGNTKTVQEKNTTKRNSYNDKMELNKNNSMYEDKSDYERRIKSNTTKRVVSINNNSEISNDNGRQHSPRNIRSETTKKQNRHDDEIDSQPKEDDKLDSTRRIRSEDTTASYEDTVEPIVTTTENVDDVQTEDYESRTKAPRSLSKLSYFQKENEVRSSVATNLVEAIGKRRFKSKCRCERIWNCPKLQITVPRCPNEYFLCCF